MSYYQRRNPRADLGGAARGAMAGCAPRQASWPEWAQCADTASYKRRCDAAGADGTASLPGAAHVLRQAHKFHTPALRPCSVAYARALTEAYLGLSMRRRTKKGLRDRNSPTCTLSQNGYGTRIARAAKAYRQTAHRIATRQMTYTRWDRDAATRDNNRYCGGNAIILAEGAIALPVTLSGGVLFAN